MDAGMVEGEQKEIGKYREGRVFHQNETKGYV